MKDPNEPSKETDTPAISKSEIHAHIRACNDAIQKNSPQLIVQKFDEFGAFLLRHSPTSGTQEIAMALEKLQINAATEIGLPNNYHDELDALNIAVLGLIENEGRISSEERICSLYYNQLISVYYGVTTYRNLMGEQLMNKAEAPISPSKKELRKYEKTLNPLPTYLNKLKDFEALVPPKDKETVAPFINAVKDSLDYYTLSLLEEEEPKKKIAMLQANLKRAWSDKTFQAALGSAGSFREQAYELFIQLQNLFKKIMRAFGSQIQYSFFESKKKTIAPEIKDKIDALMDDKHLFTKKTS